MMNDDTPGKIAASMKFRSILFESLRGPLVLATGHGYDRSPWLNSLHHKLAYRLHKMLPAFGISGIQRVAVPGKPGRFMYVRAEDGGVAHQLIMYQQYEPFESTLVQKHLKPGMTVYNIGANLGYYVLLSSESVGPNGKVFAFEPEKGNLELLQKTVLENGCSNVEIQPIAVSSESGKTTLSLSTTNSGDHQLHFVGGREHVQVPTISINNFIAERHPAPDAIIMDVQGSELDVLRGAKTFLQSGHPLILFTEFWPQGLNERHSDGANEMVGILKSAGFQLSEIDERTRQVRSVTAEKLSYEIVGNAEVNLLALRS